MLSKQVKKTRTLNTLFVSTAALAMLGTSCSKGGGSFSVLSEASNFQQEITYVPRKIDVLFVVDSSGSMADEQSALSTNFPSFINRFIDKGYDFRIGTTTTAEYLYAGNFFSQNGSPLIIDKNNYNLNNSADRTQLLSDFDKNVKVGTTGSGCERALASMKKVLDNAASLNQLRRSKAYLAVVIISDEDESYDSACPSNDRVAPAMSTYRDYLRTLTGGVEGTDFSISTVVKRNSSECTGTVGTRYQEVAGLTLGTVGSVCGNFDTTLDNISASIANHSAAEFQLSRTPLVSTIVVKIDGVVVPQSTTDGWQYIASSNSIRINGSTYEPVQGSNIQIIFDPDINGGT